MSERIRVHRIKINAEYEGEPLDEKVLDRMLRRFGDEVAIALRDRHFDADGIFVAGLHQDIDVEDTK